MNTISDAGSRNDFLNIDQNVRNPGLKRESTVNSANVSDNILGDHLDANTSKGTSNHDNILAQMSKSNTLMTEQLEN